MAPDTANISKTPSAQIKQLADIDRDVVKLLQSAGLAVKALALPQSSPENDTSSKVDFQERRESFTAAASQYFNLLSSIDVRLRRQINSLEEAGIIPAELMMREQQGNLGGPVVMPGTGSTFNPAATKQSGPRKGAITGGGLGNLDVGWLNSRNDHVGKEMEAELWEQAQRLVEKLEEDNPAAADAKALVDGSEGMSGETGSQQIFEEMD
ncbi:MAG: hypothetical protein Q9163_000814 [Psora crenata]